MKELFVNGTKLDLYDDVATPITYAIADILHPEKINTAYSKSIKIPGSKTNDNLFTHIFDVTKEITNQQQLVNFTPEFNPALNASFKLFGNGVLILSGVIQLKEILMLNNGHEYEILLTGILKNIFLSIEGKYLDELDLSEYNHVYGYTGFKNTWDTKITRNGSDYVNFSAGVPTGEGYLYPTIDYAITDGIATWNSSAISLTKSFPAVYVREYWTKIFALAGFTWKSGGFLDSELFRRLVIPYSYRKDFVGGAEITKRKFKVGRATSQTQGAKLGNQVFEMPITFDNDSTGGNFDNYPAYNTAFSQPNTQATSVWVVPKTGRYDLTSVWSGEAVLANASDSAIIKITPRIKVIRAIGYGTSTLIEGEETIGIGNSLVAGGTISGTNIDLFQGDIVYVAVSYSRDRSISIPFYNSAITFTLDAGASFYNLPVSALTSIGDTFQMNTAIPKGILIKDFLLSCIKMFNLYIEPDEDNATILKVESFVDFFSGNAIDTWVEDKGKERSEKPCATLDSKSFDFKYKKDTDYYNELYLENHGVQYGQKRFDAINDFAKGNKVIELIFSPTPMVQFGEPGSDMVIPRIFKQEANGNRVQHDNNIRILYYGGVRATNNPWDWGFLNPQTTYAYVGHLDDPFAPTLDLLFNIPKQIFYGSPSSVQYTTNNLFNKYWIQFIKEITDPDSRLVTTWIHLREDQVFNLNFQSPIYLGGVNFRLNKIIEYDPDNESTKVELVKVKEGYVFVPGFEVVVTQEDPVNFDLIEGGLDEVVSLARITNIDLIDGSIDAVINIGSATNINMINGGTNGS